MSPHKLLRFAALGLVALVALVAAESTPAPPALAAPAAPPEVRAANDVKITVVAILATDQNETIDSRVSCIAKEVRKDNRWLTGFQVHRIMGRTIFLGDTATFDVIADQKLSVSVENACTPDERMQLKIKAPTWGEMTYETCCGKFMPLMTRYRTPDNQVLILAVRVQPSKCSK
jgi:hypothetical protein